MTVRIVHLFPTELGAAGDSGNALALDYRLRQRGVDTELIAVSTADALPASADIVVIGTGPWSAAQRISHERDGMGARLSQWFDNGTSFVAMGTGAELLGQTIQLPTGQECPGLGIFPLTATRDAKRLVGYIDSTGPLGRMVGFGDLSSVWNRPVDATALGHAVIGPGRLPLEEGVLVGRSFATQIGGPVLPLNPALADWIIEGALERSGTSMEMTPLAIDDVARRAREVILDNFDQVFTTMAL